MQKGLAPVLIPSPAAAFLPRSSLGCCFFRCPKANARKCVHGDSRKWGLSWSAAARAPRHTARSLELPERPRSIFHRSPEVLLSQLAPMLILHPKQLPDHIFSCFLLMNRRRQTGAVPVSAHIRPHLVRLMSPSVQNSTFRSIFSTAEQQIKASLSRFHHFYLSTWLNASI